MLHRDLLKSFLSISLRSFLPSTESCISGVLIGHGNAIVEKTVDSRVLVSTVATSSVLQYTAILRSSKNTIMLRHEENIENIVLLHYLLQGNSSTYKPNDE